MELLSLLSPIERAKCAEIPLKKGQTLFQEGDRCLAVGFVLRGSVKIASYTMQGKEVIYNELGPGEMFGNNLLFAEEPFYRGAVIATSDGAVAMMKKEDLVGALMGNQRFLEAYLGVGSEFGKRLNFQLKILSFPSSKERLDYYLRAHKCKVHCSSVSRLAEELFLTRETLSRLLSSLEKQGIIVRNGKEIILMK